MACVVTSCAASVRDDNVQIEYLAAGPRTEHETQKKYGQPVDVFIQRKYLHLWHQVRFSWFH